MNVKLDQFLATLRLVQAEVTSRNDELDTLKAANVTLNQKLLQAEEKLNDLEQYSRRDNLIISGILPNTAELAGAVDAENRTADGSDIVVGKVVDFCKDVLDVHVTAKDISTAHRMSSRTGSSQVMVRFTQRSVRDKVYYAKGILRMVNNNRIASARYYVNEDLTAQNGKLFSAARDKFKRKLVTSAWTSGGRIFVKTPDGIKHTITSLAQLNGVTRVP